MTTALQQLLPRLRRWRRTLAENVLLVSAAGAIEYSFDEDDVARFHDSTAGDCPAAVDRQTWHDLLASHYLARLSGGVSIFGRQVLYRRLRAGVDDAACRQHADRITALLGAPDLLQGLGDACAPLRHARTEVAGMLFAPAAAAPEPWWTRCLGLVGPAFLLSMALTFAWPAAWAPAGILFAMLLAARLRYNTALRSWEAAAEAMQLMLVACMALGARGEPMLADFRHGRESARRLHRSLSRSTVVMNVPYLKDYVDWFLLGDVRHCLQGRRRVRAHLPALRECFLAVANLEADIALARHLQAVPRSCRAVRHAGKGIAFDSVVNPLLDEALPLSLELDGKGAFISGRNGVGKSTLLRTIGLNLLAARAFGFCYADSAVVSTRVVHASMQNEDSLLGGESLYIAELRRSRELLASAQGAHAGIYLIDEVFRGTNHLESISAAAAVLDEIARHGLVIVSSHNLVLASILDHCLAPLQVDATPAGMTLRPGVLVETNGIALLAERGFDRHVQERANKVFNWLNRYLAHPSGAVEL